MTVFDPRALRARTPVFAISARIVARPGGLNELRRTIERFFLASAAARVPVREADRLAITVATTEIMDDLLTHACPDDLDSEVLVVLERLVHSVTVCLHGAAVPHSPDPLLARAGDNALEHRREGGFQTWRLRRPTGLGATDDGPAW
jgi:hypothetical protein